MDDVQSITVKQIRIYAPGIIPAVALRSTVGAEMVRKRFGFREIASAPTGEITYFSGLALVDEKIVKEINFLEIGPQKTAWEVLGESALANNLNRSFIEIAAAFNPSVADAEPLLLTQETSCVVRLPFSWKDMISERLAGAVEDIRPRFDLPIASTRIAAMTLRFAIQYDVNDLRIKEWGIGVLDKTLTFEPLLGVPLDERLFTVASPLDSESHLALVRDLEKAITDKPRTSRRRS